MQFAKYGSIGNVSQKSKTKTLLREGFGATPCVVQEKLHGANFSLWTDGKRLKAAKRTGFLKTKDDFFNFQEVLDTLKPAALSLFAEQNKHETVGWIALFGELIGGHYPHPEVGAVTDATQVQKGVYYCPHNDFVLFDIMLPERRFLPLPQVHALCEGHGIRVAQTLWEGTFEECLRHPNAFPTTLPALYGLPELEDNICEGIIIRSLDEIEANTRRRILFKDKNERWQETAPKTQKKLQKKLKQAKKRRKLSVEATELWQFIAERICENRLVNVLSKCTQQERRQQKSVLRWLRQDILDELSQEHPEALLTLDPRERHKLDQFFKEDTKAFLEEHLPKHL